MIQVKLGGCASTLLSNHALIESMKYIFTFLVYILSLSGAFATGSPKIKIKLIPMAVNEHGYVLFATKSLKNPIGSNSLYRYNFGWLVVNKDGVWDEREAFHSSQSEKKDGPIYKQYDDGEINLKKPDDVLKIIMARYGFQSDNKLKKEGWVLAIKPHQSCFQGKCIDKPLKQKTLGEVASTILHTPIRSSFYYKGVALFNNIHETGRFDEVEKKEQGSSFDFEQDQIVFDGEKYPRRHPHSYIDGLVLFNPDYFDGIASSTEIKSHFEECQKSSSANKTNFTSNDNNWTICENDTETKIIKITYTKIDKDVEYTELYLIQNGVLSSAFEQEVGIKNEWIWNAKYRIINGKYADVLSSLGHGKTEDGNWDPSSILGMYKKRMLELKNIKK